MVARSNGGLAWEIPLTKTTEMRKTYAARKPKPKVRVAGGKENAAPVSF